MHVTSQKHHVGTATLDNFIERNDAATTTAYVNGLFEWQNGATTKYYDGGAMRRTGYPADNGISYVLGDQLGSTSVIAGQNGAVLATNYYLPFGGNRGGGAFSDLTTKRFTGQYHEAGLPGGEGLSFYNARWQAYTACHKRPVDRAIMQAQSPATVYHQSLKIGNSLILHPTCHL